MKQMKVMMMLSVFFMSLTGFASIIPNLKTLDGQDVQVNSQKDTLFVYVWATWCQTCEEKLSDFLPKLNQKKNIEVITINTDRNTDKVQTYVRNHNIKLKVFQDSEKLYRKKFKAFSVPHWAVFKKKRGNWVMVSNEGGFDFSKITKALKERI